MNEFLVGWEIVKLLKSRKIFVALDAPYEQFRDIKKAVQTFIGEQAYCFPSIPSPMSEALEDEELLAERAMFLSNLHEEGVFLIQIDAIIQKTPPADLFAPLRLQITKETQLDQDFSARLVNLGYQEASLASARGTFAFKGEIIDVFPPISDHGIRIYLDSNSFKVKRLAYFDALSQRSVKDLESFCFFPIRDCGIPTLKKAHLEKLEENANRLSPSLVRKLRAFLDKGERSISVFNYLAFIQHTESITRVIDRQITVLSNRKLNFKKLASFWQRRVKSLEPFSDLVFSSTNLDDIKHLLDFKELNPKNVMVFSSSNKHLKEVTRKAVLIKAKKYGFRTVFFCAPERAKDVDNYVKQNFKADTIVLNSVKEVEAKFSLIPRALPMSFLDKSLNLFCLSDSLLVSNQAKEQKNTVDLNFILEQLRGFRVGDYCVHKDYGICQFKGLELRSVEGNLHEFAALEFADSKLLLPVMKLNLLDKFAAFDAPSPSLDYLGKKGAWRKKTEKAKQIASEFASQLLKNFAVKKIERDFIYPDVRKQLEAFAQDFPYQETIDQVKAVEDCLKDLSGKYYMDRLICGDAGIGKTEVALRVAFAVLAAGKQVLMVCPTNLLVEQHYNLFNQRLSKAGFKVGKLSRLATAKEKRKICYEFGKGYLHCLIGTVAVFSSTLRAHDLGLIIFDEEHKFGVAHKEVLKNLPQTVDKLYLSATPLPRSLNLAISGLRDLSLIITPPSNRKKVYVAVSEFDLNLVKNAIEREIKRGGQVIYVVSKISLLEEAKKALGKIFPNLNLEIIHGRLSKREIEEVYYRFISRHIQVLVATSIVEAGLDIPSSNTIIVQDANNFGLAQLYQLKGRVGRGETQGFSYFLFDKSSITDAAKKRFEALSHLDQTSESFSLAVKDLEIRGVGTFLGKKQKGFVNDVGYDLFIDLVKEALYDLRGVPRRFLSQVEPEISLPVDCYIPESYVRDSFLRLSLYRKIFLARLPDELVELRLFFEDSFGNLPQPVQNLLLLAEIKFYAKIIGASKIIFRDKHFEILTLAVEGESQKPEVYKLETKNFDLNELRDKIKQLAHEKFEENFYFFADS